jgi:cysteine desulfurase/selenocysteine lyase
MEHHANLVPWQQVAERTGATLRWFGVTDEGRLDIDPAMITERTKVVSVTHQSNVLGTINPIAQLSRDGPRRRSHHGGRRLPIGASHAGGCRGTRR